MKELKTKIHGYTVELEVDDDVPESHCYISRGRHSASLELVDACGGFDDGTDDQDIPVNTIAAIRAWAEKNGY